MTCFKTKRLWWLCAAALAVSPAAAREAPVKASRPADKGCAWKTLGDKRLGIELLYERCELDTQSVDFKAKGASVFEVLRWKDARLREGVVRDGKRGDVWNAVVTVFSKKAGDSPQKAILSQPKVVASMTPFKRDHCVAFELAASDGGAPAGSAARRYTLKPDAQYAAKIERETPPEAKGDIPEPPCGDLGFNADSQSYFEFHPDEDRERFVYVDVGQDTPYFDADSIRFLPRR